MSIVLVVGNKNNFLEEVGKVFEAEGLRVIFWKDTKTSVENSAADAVDYILYSTIDEDGTVGGRLQELRSLAAKAESRLILVALLSQAEDEKFKKRDGRIDERHVFLTHTRPLFTQSLWKELKRAVFSPSLKNSYLRLNVESDTSGLLSVKTQTVLLPVPCKSRRRRGYKLLFVAAFFLLFALLPFIEFSMGTQLLKDQRLFRVSGFSQNLLAGASRGFGVYRQLPLVGGYFKSFETKARQGATLAGVIHGFGQIAEETQGVAASFFGTGKSITSNEIDELSKRAQRLDKSLDFLIAEVKDNEEELETSEIRSKVKGTLGLLQHLKYVIGDKEEKNYLVLVNNSNRLRGSGGVITDFGLLKIKDGKIESFDLNPVEDLDLKLKGQVEPPAIFKKYFQESWYLRDVGWSTDYPSVAARASWFLEKGTGIEELSGVFSLDEKIANEFKRVFEKKDKETVELFGRDLFEGLREKRVLVFTKDTNFLGVLQELGWDGGIREGVCLEEKQCVDDYLQVVSSSVVGGEVKLEKSYRLEATIEKDKISHKLTASYSNTSEQDIEDYIRIYVQKDAESFSTIALDTVTGRQQQISLDGAKEAGKDVYGFLLNLTKGEKRDVILSWSTKTLGTSVKQYNLVWQKQAGERNSKALLDIRYPGRVDPKYLITGERSALTRKGSLLYNTDLTQDITLRLLWK